MSNKGHKLTNAQRERLSESHKGQVAWNKGTGGCKKGHDPELYVRLPSGVYVCLGCKRENGAKYRQANRKTINLHNRTGRYQITIEEYRRLFDEQGGKCIICQCVITEQTCRIDHDHTTGNVRGLLCISCNTGIGLLKDSPDVLISAAEYLRKHNA